MNTLPLGTPLHNTQEIRHWTLTRLIQERLQQRYYLSLLIKKVWKKGRGKSSEPRRGLVDQRKPVREASELGYNFTFGTKSLPYLYHDLSEREE
jgi:hypothetical protein